ncbi:MAG: SpoIVB peptidase [Cellulosilyticaceae bacterium]
MRQIKKTFKYLIVISIIMIISSPLLIGYYIVPNEIKVVAGKENTVDFNVPFSEPLYVKSDQVGYDEMTVSLMGIVPLKTVSVEVLPGKEVIPSGEVIGVRLVSDGVYVLGTSEVETVEGTCNPCKDMVKKGDIIHALNDTPLDSKEHFKALIEENGKEKIHLSIERKDENLEVEVSPVYSANENTYKLGVWVKDGTQGIGTVTYVDPEDNTFGALGHGITESEIKKLIPIKEASITKTQLTSITKGMIGTPGQLSGTIEGGKKNILGEVSANTHLGIYGTLNEKGKAYLEGEKMPIAFQHEVHEGDASILLHLTGDAVEEYAIEIQKVTKYTSEPTKGMVIKITDPKLLKLTSGIVQGMSGSPILQDGKLIGAITHVFVQDPTKGYGIFIENMLNNELK